MGDGPPADQWGDLPGDGSADDEADVSGGGWDRDAPGATVEPTEPAEPNEPTEPAGPTAALAVFEPVGDGATFRVVSHADGADWSAVSVAADAGDWLVVVDGGAGGEYAVGSGTVARPEPWEVATGALLSFCDQSSTDGVTGTYVDVRHAGGGDPLLRERIQASPC